MDKEAAPDYKKTDAELNMVYKKVMKEHQTPFPIVVEINRIWRGMVRS